MIGFTIFGGSTSVFGDEPVKTLAEDCVWIHHPFLLVEEFECRRDEAKEGINKGGVHVDNVIARFEENRMCYFCSRMIVVVVACAEFGHFIDVGGEWIIVGRVRFTGGVVCVEARVNCIIEQVHLLGDG